MRFNFSVPPPPPPPPPTDCPGVSAKSCGSGKKMHVKSHWSGKKMPVKFRGRATDFSLIRIEIPPKSVIGQKIDSEFAWVGIEISCELPWVGQGISSEIPTLGMSNQKIEPTYRGIFSNIQRITCKSSNLYVKLGNHYLIA